MGWRPRKKPKYLDRFKLEGKKACVRKNVLDGDPKILRLPRTSELAKSLQFKKKTFGLRNRAHTKIEVVAKKLSGLSRSRNPHEHQR